MSLGFRICRVGSTITIMITSDWAPQERPAERGSNVRAAQRYDQTTAHRRGVHSHPDPLIQRIMFDPLRGSSPIRTGRGGPRVSPGATHVRPAWRGSPEGSHRLSKTAVRTVRAKRRAHPLPRRMLGSGCAGLRSRLRVRNRNRARNRNRNRDHNS